MTTLDAVPKKKPEPSAEETAAKELVRLAREQGLSLTGPDGLLKQFTKSVLETALNEDMTEHLPTQPSVALTAHCSRSDQTVRQDRVQRVVPIEPKSDGTVRQSSRAKIIRRLTSWLTQNPATDKIIDTDGPLFVAGKRRLSV